MVNDKCDKEHESVGEGPDEIPNGMEWNEMIIKWKYIANTIKQLKNKSIIVEKLIKRTVRLYLIFFVVFISSAFSSLHYDEMKRNVASYTTTPHTHTTPTVYASFTIRFIHDDHPSIPSLYSFHLNHQFISIILFVLSRSSIHISINPFHHSIHSISVINPFHLSIPSFYSFHLNYQSLILILIISPSI